MSVLERQKKYVFFPWTAQENAHVTEIESAQGVYFTLKNKQKVLDFSSHVFNAQLGHDHPKIKEAISKYAPRAVVPLPNGIYEERALLGETLARVTPNGEFSGLIKSFICLSGAEANENAIKMARLVTGRSKVMTRYRSYHGATLSALQYSGDYRRIPFDGAVNGVVRIPDFSTSAGQSRSLELLEEIILAEGPDTIACMLLEGIVGANGVFLPQKEFWPEARRLCDKYGILLIADEVLSGFGRTGKWFAMDHFGITPDMMTMSKGLSAGYAPIGAVIVNEKIANFFEKNKLWCGLTHYAHPLSCAVANAAIKALEDENLVANAELRGTELAKALAKIKEHISLVKEVRSIGLLAAIELQPRNDAHAQAVTVQLSAAMLEQGLYCIQRFNTLVIAPPLCISAEELSLGISRIENTLSTFSAL